MTQSISSLHHNWVGKRLLIAEDDDLTCKLLRLILSPTGIDCFWARTGLEAVNLAKEHDNIDLALLDIQMPELDGISATEILKQMNHRLPVIIQTAFAFNEYKTACQKAGCDEFITKPYEKTTLLQIMDQYLTRS